MSDVAIFWDPKGMELDSLRSKRYLRATDGDTPYISVSIRMLSIDTPEVHYPGNSKPSRQDDNLRQLAKWIRDGAAPIDPELGDYLYPKLASGKAGSLQEEQGKKATEVFKDLVEEKLSRPGSKKKRSVFLRVADQPFDRYGRLLAYMAPNYKKDERSSMTPKERGTFNLLMVETGWAAPFPIYPNLPKHSDLVLFQATAQEAYEEKRGGWGDHLTLAGYEFRMCVRLYETTRKLIKGRKLSDTEKSSWVTRFCVDVTTRRVYYPQQYYKVKPYNRIFIWPEDVREAVGMLNLLPSG